ncbi:alcohol dehydrogenase catalytic domain-containing protein [Streptomyces sp. NPDC059893]|uniref:alcohol dehydrogenase catalytic domain-containing protein n=1 Tax=Streptomyces sp. NPDC059893 TaxID=3346990 RepID=UPI00365F238D
MILRPGQVLAEPLATGICGSDLSAARHTDAFLRASRDSGTEAFLFDPDADLVMGHELCARVLSPGEWQGKVVVGLPWVLDGGGTPRTVGYATALPGGFGQRVVLQEAALIPVPDHVARHAAALTEPLAVGFGNVARAAPEPGSGAVVIGAGPIGLGAVAALVERGVAPVVVSEPSPRRRALAERFGAHVCVDPADGGTGPLRRMARCRAPAHAAHGPGVFGPRRHVRRDPAQGAAPDPGTPDRSLHDGGRLHARRRPLQGHLRDHVHGVSAGGVRQDPGAHRGRHDRRGRARHGPGGPRRGVRGAGHAAAAGRPREGPGAPGPARHRHPAP